MSYARERVESAAALDHHPVAYRVLRVDVAGWGGPDIGAAGGPAGD